MGKEEGCVIYGVYEHWDIFIGDNFDSKLKNAMTSYIYFKLLKYNLHIIFLILYTCI